MSPRLIQGYVDQAPALAATEQLDALHVQGLPRLRPIERQRALERLHRLADGTPLPTTVEEQAAKRAFWDAEWARLRGKLSRGARAAAGGPRLRPGDRIIRPGA